MDIIKTILEKFKLLELTLISFIGTVVVTFAPIEFADYLKISEFKNKYQVYISLIMIISGAYLFMFLIKHFYFMIIKCIKNPKKNAINYMLNNMSPQEMGLLISTFYDENLNKFVVSGLIPLKDGIKTPLINNKIIYLSSTVGDAYYGFAHNLYPYALDFLNYNLKKGNIDINKGHYKLKKKRN